MISLSITDHPEPREQIFDGVRVLSHSGLSFTEVILLEHLSSLRATSRKILICENRSGVLGQILKKKYQLQVTQHSFDDFYHQRLEDRWRQSGVQFSLGEDLPRNGDYDEILVQMSQSQSAEFMADLLQQAYLRLKKDGRLWIALESRHASIIKDIRNRYGSLSEISHPKGYLVFLKRKVDLKKIKSYEAKFSCPVPGRSPLIITTRPGVFAHRRVDGGAMALIKSITLEGREKVLEMGCGSGVVSLALKRQFPEASIHALDSHARAIAQTRKNALENQLELNGLQLTSSGWKGSDHFDVVIGNPPYFGDHRISAFFIDEAQRRLKKGGALWMVAKSMTWNLEYAEKQFELQAEFRHGDYQIAKWTKT